MMRRHRFAPALAVLALAVLPPAGALAVETPVLTTPTGSPTFTNAAPVLAWADLSDELTYDVLRKTTTGTTACVDASGATVTSIAQDSTGWTDPSPTADTSYCYWVRGVDGGGAGTLSNQKVIVYDTTGPTGTVTAPAASANVRGANVAVTSGDAADAGAGVSTVSFQYSPAGTGSWSLIGLDSSSAGGWTVDWDTTGLNALYDLRAVIADAAGNMTNTAVVANVRADNTAPSATLSAPAAGANVRGAAVAVTSADAADGGSGLDSLAFQRSPAGTGSWTTIATDSSSSGGWTVNWDTTAVSDGLFDLRAIATDLAGNSSNTVTVANVRVDNTAPTGTVTAPAAGANVRGANVAVSSSDVADGGSGLASVEFQRSPAGTGSWTPIATDSSSVGGWTVVWDTTGLNALYDLRAVIADAAGNTTNTVTVANVRADNTAPTGTVTAPAAGANVRGANVAVSSSDVADGGSGLASVAFQRSPAGTGSWTTIATDSSSAGGWTVDWDTTGLNALYDLRAVIADAAGNTTNTVTVANVRADNTAPTGTVTAPAAGANVRGANVAVTSANAADGGSGLASVAFQRSPAGLGTWTTIATDSSSTGGWTVDWDTTGLNGLYDLRAVIADAAGNTTNTATVANVRADNTAPTGTVTAPAAGANVRGANVAVTSNAADGGSLVASVEFQRSPPGLGTWTTIATDSSSVGGWTVDWDTTGLNALYDLRAVIADAAGNTTTTVTNANVRADNTAPTGTVTAPAASANVRGSNVAVTSATAADGGGGVASVEFQQKRQGLGTWTSIQTDTSTPWTVDWNTTSGVTDGLYDLQAVVVDLAGNSVTTAVVANVVVDNTAPTATQTAPSAGVQVSGASVPLAATPTDAGSGVTTVRFERSIAGTGSWTVIGTDSSSVGGWTFTWNSTAVGDDVYDLRAVAADGSGNETASATIANVLVDNTAPSAPGAPTATAPTTNAAATLTWPASTSGDVVGYYVYRDGSGTPLNGTLVTGTTYADTSLALDGSADGAHTYRVRAEDQHQLSPLTSSVSVTLDTVAPAVPTITATPQPSGAVSLSWSAPADLAASSGATGTIANIAVRRSAAGGAAPASASDGTSLCTPGAALTCDDPGTLHGSTYAYAVFVRDAAGNSSRGTASVTASDTAVPSAVTALVASAGDAQVALTWTPVAATGADGDAAGYVVRRKDGSSPTGPADGVEACRLTAATATGCTVTALVNGTAVHFAVYTLDEVPNHSAAATASATPKAISTPDLKKPAAPSAVKSKVDDGGRLQLTWKLPADKDLARIVVVRGKGKHKPSSPGDGKRLYSGKGKSLALKFEPGTVAWVVVFAIDRAGNVSRAAAKQVKVDPIWPSDDANVDGPVKLDWASDPKADYYHVQIFQGDKRVLIDWRRTSSLGLAKGKLANDDYTWYVWPGYGELAQARFGKLIGKAAFSYRR